MATGKTPDQAKGSAKQSGPFPLWAGAAIVILAAAVVVLLGILAASIVGGTIFFISLKEFDKIWNREVLPRLKVKLDELPQKVETGELIVGQEKKSDFLDTVNKSVSLVDKIISSGKEKPKKASKLNQELYKEHIIKKGEMMQITAWLDIRNSSAHGNYDEYDKDKVDIMIKGIRSFISIYPA